MTTLLAPEGDDSADSRGVAADALSARGQWLWTLLGLALLGAFLAFVVDDFPLRVISSH